MTASIPLTTDEVISLAVTVLLDANPFDTRYEFTQTQLVSFAHKVAAICDLEAAAACPTSKCNDPASDCFGSGCLDA